MIFKTFETYDKDSGVITDKIGWLGPDIGPFKNAKAGKQKFDNEMFNRDLEAQKKAVQAYAIAYDAAYDDVMSRSDEALGINKELTKDQKKARREQIATAEATSKAHRETEWASEATKKYCRETERANISVDDFATKQRNSFDAQKKLGSGLKGLSASTKALGLNLGADLAIGAAINLAIKGFQKLNEVFKLTDSAKLEAMETAVNDYSTAIDDSQSNISTIESLRSEFTRLAQGVDNAGKNVGLSADDFQRYNQIVSELININPSLVKGYTAEGNAIIDRNNAIKESIQLQKESAQQATKQYTTKETGQDIIDGSRVNMRNTLDDLRQDAKDVNKLLGSKTSFVNIAPVGKAGSIRSTYSDLFQEVLGEEAGNIDLQRATASQLKTITDHRAEILAYAQKTNKYDKEDLTQINTLFDSMEAGVSQLEADTQPIYDWLSAYATQINSATGTSLMDTIPDELSSAYEAGLREISMMNLDPADMKTEANTLADSLVDVYDSKKVKNAMQEFQDAQDEFLESDRTDADVSAYEDSANEQIEILDSLAARYQKTYEETQNAADAALAASLRSQANSMRDFLQNSIPTLETAFNPIVDKIDQASNAKTTFDEWRQGIDDYGDGVESFKGIFDSVLDGMENAGDGSQSFWHAAEMAIGRENLKELGYDIDKVNDRMETLQASTERGYKGTDAFYTSLRDNMKEINKLGDGAKVWEKDGMVGYDIDSDMYDEVADILGISEDLFVAWQNNARQFSNIDISDTGQIKEAIKGLTDAEGNEITFNAGEIDGEEQLYQFYDTVEAEAMKAGLSASEFQDRVKELEKDGVHLIDLSDNAKTVASSFVEMSDVFGKKNAKTGEIDLNSEAVMKQMFDMGRTADDVYETFEKFQKSDKVDIGKQFENMSDDELRQYIDDMQSTIQEAEESGDPFEKFSAGADKFTAAINSLIAAMGQIPDIDINSNLEGTEDKIQDYQKNYNSMDTGERKIAESDITADLKERKKELKTLETAYNNLSKAEQKSEEGIQLKADIDDATTKLNSLKDLYNDIKDDGAVNGSIKLSDEDAQAKLDAFKESINAVDNKEVTAKCKAAVDSGNLEAYIDKLNLTPEEKTTVLNAITAAAEGDLSTFISEFDKLPESVQTQITALINDPNAIADLAEQVENIDGKNAQVEVSAKSNNASKQIDQVDSSMNTLNGTSANVTIIGSDGATPAAAAASQSVGSVDGSSALSFFRGNNADTLSKASQTTVQVNSVPDSRQTQFTAIQGGIAAVVANVRSLINSIPSHKTITIGAVSAVSGVVSAAKAAIANNAKGTPNRRRDAKAIDSKAEGSPERRKGTDDVSDIYTEGQVYGNNQKDINRKLRNRSTFDSKARGGGKREGGPTLTGELAPELVWLPSEQKSMIVGEYGPEMVNLPSDAVVYPGDETRRILAGRNTHREFGSFARGSGYRIGSGGGSSSRSSGRSGGTNPSDKSVKNSDKLKKNTEKTEKSAKKTKEHFDWIEVKLDRIQRRIDKYDKIANRTNRMFKGRQKYYNLEYKAIQKEIKLQQKGEKRYLKQANKVNLSGKWKKKVRNGEIDIDTIKNDKLKKRIKNYQEWYEKALDCRDAVVDLKTQLAEIQKEKFDLITIKFEAKLEGVDFKSDMIDEKISQAENRGRIINTQYYTNQKSIENSRISLLEQEKKELQKQFDAAVKSGKVLSGSEMWYEMKNEIDNVSLSIEEARTRITELDDAIREVNYEIFDRMQDSISQITQEGDFLIGIMENDKLYEDNGQLTDKGMATMGLHGVNYNTYMAQADKYAAELKKIQAELANDPYNTNILDRRNELLKAQQESIQAAEDEKDAIRDMVEEGIELELDALDKLIEKYTDALNSQKDLYDYQQEVTEQTEEIASLQKQLAAYANDDSEEAKQKKQEIQASLEEAEKDLQETEWDHYIDAQEELLDELYTQYEEILNMRLDNIDLLISDMITEINANAGTISSTISSEAASVGYNLTSEMSRIWGEEGSIISNYGEGFLSSNNNVVQVVSGIRTNVAAMTTAAQSTSTTLGQILNKMSLNSTNTNSKKKKSSKTVYFAGGKDAFTVVEIKKKKPQTLKKPSFLTQMTEVVSGAITGVKFKSGTKKVPRKELAWTNEGSPETIIRKSDGAILTPLKAGDMVLNTAAHENIWSMANDPTRFIRDHFDVSVPAGTNINSNSNDTYQVENEININLDNVTSYQDFVYAMQHDKNFEKMIQDMSINQLFGGSSLKKYKY